MARLGELTLSIVIVVRFFFFFFLFWALEQAATGPEQEGSGERDWKSVDVWRRG